MCDEGGFIHCASVLQLLTIFTVNSIMVLFQKQINGAEFEISFFKFIMMKSDIEIVSSIKCNYHLLLFTQNNSFHTDMEK